MTLTNNEIYIYAKNLTEAFNDKDQKLPIKINFYLQKNKNILSEMALEIEKERIGIASSCGVLDETGGQYVIPPEKIVEVSKELEELLSLTQEVQIYTIKLEDLDSELMLTTMQMEALMFMIE